MIEEGAHCHTLIVYYLGTRVDQRSLPSNWMIHEGNVRDLVTDHAAHMRECCWIRCEVKGTRVERGRIGVGVEVARDFVVNTEDVLDVWKRGKVGAERVQLAIVHAVCNIVTEQCSLVIV